MAIRHYTVLHTVAILRDILHCTVRNTALYCVTYGIILCAAVSISLLLASPGLAFSPFSYSVIVLSLNLRSCRQLQRHRGVAMDTCDGPLMEVYPLIKVSKKHSWKPHRALKQKRSWYLSNVHMQARSLIYCKHGCRVEAGQSQCARMRPAMVTKHVLQQYRPVYSTVWSRM